MACMKTCRTALGYCPDMLPKPCILYMGLNFPIVVESSANKKIFTYKPFLQTFPH